ncbi:hypothetical protein C440_04913 [Haloferax mucosum ATCC BAA-1512]|uniref:Uncharacterized protein n=1 Tax=Haloferax mucosum ATCC BAA-1512 TaxID=662479 RepID=M0II68_9EURY|nr:hypothetical protein [Haloferax mucosum]ELZ96460.1 hypothetical protein C440_04913 [Haloferax mucosum ATCC BAA-1512]
MSSKHPSTSTTDDKPTVPHWTHDYELVRIGGDDAEIVELISGARAQSYTENRTREVIHDPSHRDARDTFSVGDRAEVAVALALNRNPLEALDLRKSETGDDGSDLTLGCGAAVDVKGHENLPIGDPPKLLVEEEKVERGDADVYVLAQVWDSEWAVVHGWTIRKELMWLGHVEREWWNEDNWELDAEKLRSVDRLRNWDF